MKKSLTVLVALAAFTLATGTQAQEPLKATVLVTGNKSENKEKAQAYLDQFTNKNEIKQSWSVNRDGIPWAMSEDLGWKAIVMLPEKKVVFQAINEPCTSRDKTKVIPVYVNNKKTDFLSMCFQNSFFYLPAGDVFNEVVFNEFKNKNSVEVGNKMITAKGFTRALAAARGNNN